MKQIVFGVVSFGIIACITAIVMVVESMDIRETQLKSHLSGVMNVYMEKLVAGELPPDYSIEILEQNIRDELWVDIDGDENLAKDDKFKLDVDIIEFDYEKGLLSVQAIEHYAKLNGKIGEVVCEKTAIIDRNEMEDAQVSYMIGDEIYRKYIYRGVANDDGLEIYPPANPQIQGLKFKYWKSQGSNEQVVFPVRVKGGATYVAVFE